MTQQETLNSCTYYHNIKQSEIHMYMYVETFVEDKWCMWQHSIKGTLLPESLWGLCPDMCGGGSQWMCGPPMGMTRFKLRCTVSSSSPDGGGVLLSAKLRHLLQFYQEALGSKIWKRWIRSELGKDWHYREKATLLLHKHDNKGNLHIQSWSTQHSLTQSI